MIRGHDFAQPVDVLVQRYVPPLHQAVGEHTQRRAGRYLHGDAVTSDKGQDAQRRVGPPLHRDGLYPGQRQHGKQVACRGQLHPPSR